MKTKLALLTFVLSALLVFGVEKPGDLTLAAPNLFKKHVGKVVTLRGRLDVGKEGYCLWGSTPTNVVFYVVPDMPPSGSYSYPASWEQLLHNQVRVTGELKFHSFHRPTMPSVKKGTTQELPDYYYMVLQRTQVEKVAKK